MTITSTGTLPHMLAPVPRGDGPYEAAFFDLDKTLISKAALVAFTPVLYRAGYLSKRLIARAAWTDLMFRRSGVDEAAMQRFRDEGLAIIKGWDSAAISALIRASLDDVVPPIVYPEALRLIEHHRANGRVLFLVSAGPEEVVVPLAEHLGLHGVIASRADIDLRGRYTGRAGFWAYGQAKADAMLSTAEHLDIDLLRSWAYSDSVTDQPMLEAVGHAVATNPDAALARLAVERGWDQQRLELARPAARIPLSPRQGFVAVAVGAGIGTFVWWLVRRGGAFETAR